MPDRHSNILHVRKGHQSIIYTLEVQGHMTWAHHYVGGRVWLCVVLSGGGGIGSGVRVRVREGEREGVVCRGEVSRGRGWEPAEGKDFLW